MASIKRLANGKYKGRYRDSSRESNTCASAKKSDVQDWLDEKDGPTLQWHSRRSKRSKMPLGEWADLWLRTKVNLKPSTYATYTSIVKTKIKPCWYAYPLARLQRERGPWIGGSQRLGTVSLRVRHIHTVFWRCSTRRSSETPRGEPGQRTARSRPVAHLPDTRAGRGARLRLRRISNARARARLRRASFRRGCGAAGPPVRYARPARDRRVHDRGQRARDVRRHKTHQARSVPAPAFARDLLAEELAGKGRTISCSRPRAAMSCASTTSGETPSTVRPRRSA